MSKDPIDISRIPKGVYCYDNNGNCPYGTYKTIKTPKGDVVLNYCEVLKECDSHCTDEEFDKLLSLHGDEDSIWDAYPLDLLWDSCKECGYNDEYDY